MSRNLRCWENMLLEFKSIEARKGQFSILRSNVCKLTKSKLKVSRGVWSIHYSTHRSKIIKISLFSYVKIDYCLLWFLYSDNCRFMSQRQLRKLLELNTFFQIQQQYNYFLYFFSLQDIGFKSHVCMQLQLNPKY